MKSEEEAFFKMFVTTHPEFLGLKTWVPGPEPPDVIIMDNQSRRLGIELTEWLDDQQATPSISDSENQYQCLAVLDTENSPPPQHFQQAQIWFCGGKRLSQRDRTSFRREFYALVSEIDSTWQQQMAGTAQKIWNDFSNYPILRKYIRFIRFEDRMPYRRLNR